MPETWFKVLYGDKIEEVEVIKETPRTVVIKHPSYGELREHKQTGWYSYYKTAAEAIERIRQRLSNKVDVAETKYHAAIKELNEFNEKYPK